MFMAAGLPPVEPPSLRRVSFVTATAARMSPRRSAPSREIK
jgi:hypothetical protein